MKNNFTLSFIIYALLLAFIPSCKTNPPIHRNIICYIDFSENPNFDKRVAYYSEIVNNIIIKNMSFNDRLIVLPIDNGTVTNSSEIIDSSLKKQFDYIPDGTSPLDENDVAQKNIGDDKQKISDNFNLNIEKAISDRSNLQKGTDIIGALSNVSKYYQGGQENIVILLSDMMNWSDNLKMEEGSFTANMIDSKLAQLPKIDGKSTKILVHSGDLTNISNKHFTVLNQFWTKYFLNNNFILVDYSSGAKSKLEELMTTPVNE